MKRIIYITLIFVLTFWIGCKDDVTTPTDKDSETVKICNQVWMTKNLDVVHYRNGDIIPQVTDSSVWNHLTTGAWCYFKNDSAQGKISGKLYNWFAVTDPRGLAPEGWHIPSEDEWFELQQCLGGFHEAGGKMKMTGTKFWAPPNTGATNSSGFSAIPGGQAFLYDDEWDAIYCLGFWWSSTEAIQFSKWARHVSILNNAKYMDIFAMPKESGLSVRCIKD